MKKARNAAAVALFLLFLVPAAPMPALADPSGDAAAGSGGDSRLKLFFETGFAYDDNVFRLSDDQVSKLEADAAEDRAGGRFDDMESASDYIVSPEAGLSFKADSPLGGEFTLAPRVRYNFYTQNQACSYPEGKVRVKNTVGARGDLILEGSFTLDYFKKNYLSSVDDANGNGNISRSERTYSAATYDEYTGTIAYRHELLDADEGVVTGLRAGPFAGYGVRTYDSAFSNRDQDIALLGLGLDVELCSLVDLEMTCRYEWVSCPGDDELVLYDETVSGVDVNGDGTVQENAALTTAVDRSSRRYTIEVVPSVKIAKNARIFAGYKRRITDYESDNPLDVDHYEQRACRQEIGAGVRYDFLKALSAEASWSRTMDDVEEDDGDYTKNVSEIKVRYSF